MDKPLVLGASIYKTYRIYGDFDSKTTGFNVTFEQELLGILGGFYWIYTGAGKYL